LFEELLRKNGHTLKGCLRGIWLSPFHYAIDYMSPCSLAGELVGT
jgi:hypothetical protein